jgi:hypothetical protein
VGAVVGDVVGAIIRAAHSRDLDKAEFSAA